MLENCNTPAMGVLLFGVVNLIIDHCPRPSGSTKPLLLSVTKLTAVWILLGLAHPAGAGGGVAAPTVKVVVNEVLSTATDTVCFPGGSRGVVQERLNEVAVALVNVHTGTADADVHTPRVSNPVNSAVIICLFMYSPVMLLPCHL